MEILFFVQNINIYIAIPTVTLYITFYTYYYYLIKFIATLCKQEIVYKMINNIDRE